MQWPRTPDSKRRTAVVWRKTWGETARWFSPVGTLMVCRRTSLYRPKRVNGLPPVLKNTGLDGAADCRRLRSIASITRAVSGHNGQVLHLPPLPWRLTRGGGAKASCPIVRPTTSAARAPVLYRNRSEEHTSELQSHLNLVCR